MRDGKVAGDEGLSMLEEGRGWRRVRRWWLSFSVVWLWRERERGGDGYDVFFYGFFFLYLEIGEKLELGLQDEDDGDEEHMRGRKS